MIPVMQTKLHDPDNGVLGNCYAACFASLLGLAIADVPEFENAIGHQDLIKEVRDWAEGLGFQHVEFPAPGWRPRGYHIASGQSPRDPDIWHCVIFKNGELVHDPHPSGDGITTVEEYEFLIPLDPEKHPMRPI